MLKWIIVGWSPILEDSYGVTRRDIHHYKIERRSMDNTEKVWTDWREISRSLVSFFIDTGHHKAKIEDGRFVYDFPVEVDHTYDYRVRAVTNGNEEGTAATDTANMGKPEPPDLTIGAGNTETFTFDQHDKFQFMGDGSLQFKAGDAQGAEWYRFWIKRKLTTQSWTSQKWYPRGLFYHSGAGDATQTATLTYLSTGYDFKIRARAYNGPLFVSDWSDTAEVTTTDTVAPGIPDRADADVTPWSKNIVIDWSKVPASDLKRYRLYEKRYTAEQTGLAWNTAFSGIDSTASEVDLDDGNITKASGHTIRDAGWGSSYIRKFDELVSDYEGQGVATSNITNAYYYYWMIGEDRHGNWDGITSTCMASCKLGPPNPPTWAESLSWINLSFQLFALKVYSIDVKWRKQTGADFGYIVEWKTGNMTKYWKALVPEADPTESIGSYSLPIAFHGQSYTIRVRSWNAFGISSPATTTFTIPKDTTAPDAPTSPAPTITQFQALGWALIGVAHTTTTHIHGIYVNNTNDVDSAVHLMDAWGIPYMSIDYIWFGIGKIQRKAPDVWSGKFGTYYFWVTNTDYAGNESAKVYCGYAAPSTLDLDVDTDLRLGDTLDVTSGGEVNCDGTLKMNDGSDIDFYDTTGTLLGRIDSNINGLRIESKEDYNVAITTSGLLRFQSNGTSYGIQVRALGRGTNIDLVTNKGDITLGNIDIYRQYIWVGGKKYRWVVADDNVGDWQQPYLVRIA
jgi:hypothetical protein